MNIYDFVKTNKDEPLTFAGFGSGSFKYQSKELKLLVELEPHRLNDCEFANEETITTLFEQLDYYDDLDFTHEGKFIGSLSNRDCEKFLETDNERVLN